MKGVKPEWMNLPRRKCDDCGKSYKPKQPLRKNERGFCSSTCRKSYHKHGGAYRKLKGEMLKLVYKELEEFKALQRQVIANAIQGWIHEAENVSRLPNH